MTTIFPFPVLAQQTKPTSKQWMRVPRCEACSGTLGTRTTKAGKASYHTACFRCMVCRKNFGPGNRFRKDGWGGMVHVEHFPQTGLCGTCSRIFPKRNALKEQFFADGRMTCGPCLKDGIFKLDLLKEVDDRVWKSLVQVGFAKPKGKIILELVDQKTLLREAAKINASGNLRGLTLTKYRIVKGGKTRARLSITEFTFSTAFPTWNVFPSLPMSMFTPG